MSGDKRTVTTDALETLGTIIGPSEKRDAIHLAVEPAVAGHYLEPGDHVTMEGGKALKTAVGKGLGIVDPFLTEPVMQGQRFWFVVYPRKISSLRHVWEHPSFPASGETSDDKSESVTYIQNLANEVELSYERLLSAAGEYLDHGDYITGGSEMEGVSVPEAFWPHYQKVTGRLVPYDKQGNFFSCSC